MYNKYTKEVGGYINKVIFSNEQVKVLSKNKYVKNVSNRSIAYTAEFIKNKGAIYFWQ